MIMEDIKNSFSFHFYTMVSVGRNSTRKRRNISEDLVGFINFYLRKSKRNEITVTTNEDGECVLVSRQDEDHNILK